MLRAYFRSNYRVNFKQAQKEILMGINTESNVEASLQIGPTEKGMVRLYVSNNSIEIPMDFEPDEAREIADEILSAAKVAAELVDTKRS